MAEELHQMLPGSCASWPTVLCGRKSQLLVGWFLHVCCNPDVAPRLTSGGYEDKDYVFTPINILFRGDGKF